MARQTTAFWLAIEKNTLQGLSRFSDTENRVLINYSTIKNENTLGGIQNGYCAESRAY